MARDLALDKLLLKARFAALLESAAPEVLRRLERALASFERDLRPSRGRGRPPLPRGTLRELKLDADFQRLLGARTDKEAIERVLSIVQPHASRGDRPHWTPERVARWRKDNPDILVDLGIIKKLSRTRSELNKRWRSRLATARKKSTR